MELLRPSRLRSYQHTSRTVPTSSFLMAALTWRMSVGVYSGDQGCQRDDHHKLLSFHSNRDYYDEPHVGEKWIYQPARQKPSSSFGIRCQDPRLHALVGASRVGRGVRNGPERHFRGAHVCGVPDTVAVLGPGGSRDYDCPRGEDGNDGSFEHGRATRQAKKKELPWKSMSAEEIPSFRKALKSEWAEWTEVEFMQAHLG